MYISPCFRNATASTTANFISVHMLVCAFFFFFFCAVYAWLYISLYLDTLACTFFFLCIPLRTYLISQSVYACRTLYIFYVYLYVYILLLEVYIQGCVFIYKNAYLKRMYKKEKCIHYVAHFFLPAAAGRMLKMYTHACTHKKPSQRAGHISKNAYICRHIFSVVLCIHMHALFFLLLSFCRHPFASRQRAFFHRSFVLFFCLFPPGVFAIVSQPFLFHFAGRHIYFFCTFSSLLQPIFCTSFSSYIIHREYRPSMKSIWEEKSCKIKKEKYARPSIKILYKQRKK